MCLHVFDSAVVVNSKLDYKTTLWTSLESMNTLDNMYDWDQFRFLGNCPLTPPLSHRFALREN